MCVERESIYVWCACAHRAHLLTLAVRIVFSFDGAKCINRINLIVRKDDDIDSIQPQQTGNEHLEERNTKFYFRMTLNFIFSFGF